MRLLRRRAATVAAAGLAAAAGAVDCSEATPHPAVLGGCTGSYDAACVVGGVGGGGGGGHLEDGGLDSGASSREDAGGASGGSAVDMALGAPCAACVEAPQDGGSLSCSGYAASCAADVECVAALRCVLMCQGGGCLVQSACSLYPPSSLATFNGLAGCMQTACPSAATACPTLPQVSADEQ